jgi:sugar/nucleoside kinase (ribokinase family)
VGKDFVASEFNKEHIDYSYTHVSEGLLTPSAHIITDDKNNQITAFYPGASIESGQQAVHDVIENVDIAIVSPNAPTTMLKHLIECEKM